MMNPKTILRLSLVLFLLVLSVPPQRNVEAAIPTYLVDTTEDELDSALSCAAVSFSSPAGPDGKLSLREAICAANNHPNDPAGKDRIEFDIPDSECGSGVCTIVIDDSLAEPFLPVLTDSHGVIIDGTTQSENQGTNNPDGPEIVIDGSAVLMSDPPTPLDYFKNGMNIASSNNEIIGLVINNFPLNGIAIADIDHVGVSGNKITGCCIGTGSDCEDAEGNGYDGIYIGVGATGNWIGGPSPADQNILARNGWDGVAIHGAGTNSNHVVGNLIFGNLYHGVYIYGGAQYNVVGGSFPQERNLIYNNTRDGVRIHGPGTDDNVVSGNYIGTDLAGSAELGNHANGVQVTAGSQSNLIGGGVAGAGNLISANLDSGVVISGTGTISNTVVNNLIGTDPSGGLALGNQGYGVYLFNGAQYNLIGGQQAHDRNVISGNLEDGVALIGRETMTNTISGNYIGTTSDGESALPNQEYGVFVMAPQNTIGGNQSGAGNLISGNSMSGIMMYAFDTATGNLVAGNRIGTDKDGESAVANGVHGVYISFGASGNLVGGDNPGFRNLISGNTDSGVYLIGEETISNTVSGNYIGTNLNGTACLSNGENGIVIDDAPSNTIGGEITNQGNLISGNGINGIRLTGSQAISNTVAGNYIGTDAAGETYLDHIQDYGVLIEAGASGNTIGGISELDRNVISANMAGVVISDTGTIENSVLGNYIGLDASGQVGLPNMVGVAIMGGAQDNTVGAEAGAAPNLIAANTSAGVAITNETTRDNTVHYNIFGLSEDRSIPLGNQYAVLLYSAQSNLVGHNLIVNSTVTGVGVSQTASLQNIITQNSMAFNTIGIDLLEGAHGGISPPVITEVISSTTTLTAMDIIGTACPGCTVELFESHFPHAEGEYFLGDTTADAGGAFSLSGVEIDENFITATATDPDLGTSEFSDMYTIHPELYLPLVVR